MASLKQLTYDDIEEYDVFNYENSHSYSDDDLENYNCMSYAFNAFEWLYPIDYDYEMTDDLVKELNFSENNQFVWGEIEEALDSYNFNNHFLRKIMVKRILEAFPDLRIISSFEYLKPDEYGIAFATGEDDFHFIRYEDGVYSHKRGGLDIEVIQNEQDGFGTRYNSKIIHFAMKKGRVNFNEV